MTEGQRGTRTSVQNIVLGSCLLLVSVAALALALFPIYVIRPFREQKPAALQHALWVTLHDKPILFGLFLLIAICTLFTWRRAGWVPRRLLLAPAMTIALLAAAAAWVNPYEQMMFHPFGEPRLSHPRDGISPCRE